VTQSFVSPQVRQRVRGMALPVAMALGRLGLTPNMLTLIGFAGTCVAAAVAAGRQWLTAGILVIVFGIFDLFDGALARATGKASKLGAFMDSVFDRWGEGVLYVGIAWGCAVAGFIEGAVLATAALASAVMVSYTRAKSEGLGFTTGSGMAAIGLAPREVRVLILAAGLILAGLGGGVTPLPPVVCAANFGGCPEVAPHFGATALGLAMGVITILATVTTVQRILHVIQQDSAKEHR
jgi:CDP-diacylglycerol--glycerol-3-phosphate 3-phosphatidyltransferase